MDGNFHNVDPGERLRGRPSLASRTPRISSTLLAVATAACATVQQPPGGPPDPDPPILLSVTPDSGEAVAGFDDEVIFEFDEVINESSIENLFTVSPRHEEVHVSWKRKRIGIKPRDGWRDSVPYRVTMDPGITDLRNNRTEEGYEAIFTTGGPVPNTVINGNTIDWEGGRIAGQSLIEAIRVSDSLTFLGRSDSLGTFNLEAVPPGRYVLSAAIDQNSNRQRDRRESFDTVTVTLDSAVTHDFWMFAHDTVGPRIQGVTLIDSLAVNVDYNQSLALELPGAEAARVLLLPDSVPVAVEGFMWRAPFDSLRAAQRDSLAAIADSLAAIADSIRADSIAAAAAAAAPADTTAAPDSLQAPPPGGPPRPGPPGAQPPGAEPPRPGAQPPGGPPPGAQPPTGQPPTPAGQTPPAAGQPPPSPGEEAEPDPERERQEALLAQRQQLRRTAVLLLAEPLLPGERYVVETTVRNLLSAEETSLRVLAVPVPDSTANE